MNLHDYQRVAVAYLQARPRAGLFLDMGLGKTASSLSALTPDRLPALVFAPKRVAEKVWSKEARLWRPDLKVDVIAGTANTRAQLLAATTADVVVISRDNQGDILKTTRRGPAFKTLIIDELSGYKTKSTTRWKQARKIIDAEKIVNVWGLTGTPAPNGLADLWGQIALLDDGARLGRTLTAFRSRFFAPGRQLSSGVIVEWKLRPGADAKIQALLEDICLSMESTGRIDLPPVTHNLIEVDLPPEARRMYKQLKEDLVADMEVLGERTIFTASNAAALTSKLSQLSAGFLYPDVEDRVGEEFAPVHREKINAVQEVIDGTGSPVLVFYRFRAELKMLREALPQARLVSEDGVLDAWDAGNVPVLLAHPASAGHGLNLQYGGHTIVWTSLPWSLEEWQQANKRLARQGQKHPVVIHQIAARRTVDSVIHARLEGKATVQDALRDHLESPL